MYYHRHDRDELISHLAASFPKCFFEDPGQRRPLKRGIIADLEQQKVLDHNKLIQALDWYESHFTYRRSLIAGAERVDRDGRKAGTVTPQEQREARLWVVARKKEMRELQQAAVPSPPTSEKSPAINGHLNGAAMSKTAPPLPNLHPSLVPLREAVAIVDDILTAERYTALRTVLATAALREIIVNAEKLIGTLQQGAQPS
jgi:sRNA-binding protein